MLSLFKKNPVDKLKNEYNAILEQAMNAQRNGDVRGYSELSVKADEVLTKIDEIEKSSK